MKKLVFTLLRGGLSAAYAVMKLFIRPKDRVVFLSRQSDVPSTDFRLLEAEIKRLSPSTECVFSCKLGLKSEMGLSYIPLLLRQMALLAGAKACITESFCPPISLLRHRKSLRVVQIWHSMVAIKRFGWQTVGTEEGSSAAVAEGMRMHKGYDFVCVGSEYMREFFAEAMRQPIDSVLPLGSPHADVLLARDKAAARAEAEKVYPQLAGRRLVLYAPTMRRGEAIDCEELISSFDYDSAALMVKLHPLDRHTRITDERVILDTHFSTGDAVCAADAVISDYSGVCADAALLDKPVFFFMPDIERYSERCGLNFRPDELFASLSFTDAKGIIAALDKAPDSGALARLRELLAGGCDGHSAERIARLTLRINE